MENPLQFILGQIKPQNLAGISQILERLPFNPAAINSAASNSVASNSAASSSPISNLPIAILEAVQAVRAAENPGVLIRELVSDPNVISMVRETFTKAGK